MSTGATSSAGAATGSVDRRDERSAADDRPRKRRRKDPVSAVMVLLS
jgi:hypothetical protein